MTTHVYALLGLVTLCAFWGIFQMWLRKADPDTAERSNKCGGCNGQCEK
jgi:hypothetical protein